MVYEALVNYLQHGFDHDQQASARALLATLAVAGDPPGAPLWSRLETTGNLSVPLALLQASHRLSHCRDFSRDDATRDVHTRNACVSFTMSCELPCGVFTARGRDQ